MDNARSVDDRLRDEYVRLLPDMRRTLTSIETEVNYALLRLKLGLHPYEQILVKTRLKECESAINSLKQRQEFATFASEHPERYSLTSLPDLVGVRILIFPQRHLRDVQRLIAPRIAGWVEDHLHRAGSADPQVALKYRGYWEPNDPIMAEIQIMSLLIGLFWEVEHSAVYKASPKLRGLRSDAMKTRYEAVLTALQEFEEEFERQIDSTDAPSQ